MTQNVEGIVKLLTFLLLILVACLFLSEWKFQNDAQFFQVISNMASGVLGALLGIITGKRSADAIETAKPNKAANAANSTSGENNASVGS